MKRSGTYRDLADRSWLPFGAPQAWRKPTARRSLGIRRWRAKGMLIAAINPTVAPIQYIDDDGNIIGLDVDLGNAIAERLCLKMEFQSTQFATMIPILKEGRIDLINSFMFYTPERASQVLMVPYGASSMAIVVPKKNTDDDQGPGVFLRQALSLLSSAPSTEGRAGGQRGAGEGRQAGDRHPHLRYLCRRAAGARRRSGGRCLHRHRAGVLLPQEGRRTSSASP